MSATDTARRILEDPEGWSLTGCEHPTDGDLLDKLKMIDEKHKGYCNVLKLDSWGIRHRSDYSRVEACSALVCANRDT